MKTKKPQPAAITAPFLDQLLRIAKELPNVTDEKTKAALSRLYDSMRPVAVSGDDEHRHIWLNCLRGSIEDFGDYDDYLKEEEVSSRKEFEELWQYEYPEPVKWYEFSVNEYNNERFFFVDRELICRTAPKAKDGLWENEHIDPLISWLQEETDRCAKWLQTDEAGYNRYLNENLSYSRRTGRILRQKFWDIFPEVQQEQMEGISSDEMKILSDIVARSNDNYPLQPFKEMTAKVFFDCCKIGYTVNNYEGVENKSPVELYKAFADGRDEGLMKIDPDSPEAFSRWFDGERQGFSGGGHPWEVCRGGNSTHISLYVQKEKTGGWTLSLKGSSIARVNETVKFAIGLYKNKIPFRLIEAQEILDMMAGADYIGIVPKEIFPRYCHSFFPSEERIIDFMNLGWEETDRLIKAADWYPVEIKAATGDSGASSLP
jgi:hypothetical protein